MTVVAASGRRVVCQTLDVTGRCDLGFDTAAFTDAVALAQQRAHDHEHMAMEGTDTDADLAMSMDDDSATTMAAEMANPSGHVDLTLAVWAATFTDDVLAGVLTHTLLPDPWRNVDPLELDGRGDGLDVS